MVKFKSAPNRIIGSGTGCVYLYYYENDKTLALSQGSKHWECKIGYTTKSILKRFFEQGVTASIHRHPVIALEIRTNIPQVLETRIHREMKDQKITDSAGNEWYKTNPEEVEKIYENLLPSISAMENTIGSFAYTSTAIQIDSPESLGSALRKLRLHIGDSQGEIGKQAGMRQGTISKVENGSGGTRIDTIFELLHAFGYSIIIAKTHDI